jgi:hypothetical protein
MPRVLLLVAPVLALILSGASLVDGLGPRGKASAAGPSAAVRDTSDPAIPASPMQRGSTLRPGKRLHRLLEIALANDPTVDETSDDPADDDDAWDDLNGFEDTEAPVTAWLQESAGSPGDPEGGSVPVWAAPPLFTSFLTLQRLRC